MVSIDGEADERFRYLLQLEEVHRVIVSTATSILESRITNPHQDIPSNDPRLLELIPVFAQLRDANRRSYSTSAMIKERVGMERNEIDKNALKLSNLEFQKSHLEREIWKCEEFETEYDNIPLYSEEEFYEKARQVDATIQIPTNEHELMLARLRFEVEERKRLDSKRKALLSEKTKLIRENESKKKKLDALEQKLDQFIESAQGIQRDMATFQ